VMTWGMNSSSRVHLNTTPTMSCTVQAT
jgi:hypothetical protein